MTKAERRDYDAIYYAKNREKILARKIKYYLANREELLRKISAHANSNKHIRRQWEINNRDKMRGYVRKRRARRYRSSESYTVQQWLDLKTFYENRCLGCGLDETAIIALGRMLTPDHVIPLAKGGTDDIGNIQPLCFGKGGCNNKKSARHIDYRSR